MLAKLAKHNQLAGEGIEQLLQLRGWETFSPCEGICIVQTEESDDLMLVVETHIFWDRKIFQFPIIDIEPAFGSSETLGHLSINVRQGSESVRHALEALKIRGPELPHSHVETAWKPKPFTLD